MPAHRFRSFSRLAPVVLTALAAVACGSDGDASFKDAQGNDRTPASPTTGSSSGSSGTPGGQAPNTTAPNTSGTAQRAIEEADIVQIQNGRLYALSKTGSLSIIDVSKPNQLSMLGQAYLPGEPFEMYLNGDRLTIMMNGVYSPAGQVVPASGAGATYKTPEVNSSAGVLVIDVKDPGLLQRVGTFAVPGEIADSRLAGNTLYVVTFQNSGCWSCAAANSTVVTSFDLTSPSTLKQVSQVSFGRSSGSTGSDYKRSMIFGNGHLWVGSQAGTAGSIDLVDASDPGGKLEKGAHITTAGPIVSRWQMSEKDSMLRVVSQQGNGTTPTDQPQIETFTIWNARSVQAVAKVPLQLPRMESLKSVRFDADRAYAITFERTDPLFIIDLSDPNKPQQRGELEIPGYVVHLEPRGDRLIGLGVDDRDASGQLNVSLFDVSNMDSPKMLSRVAFGGYGGGTNETVQAEVLPEDQDRMQKAFRISSDGLITVPYSSRSYDNCTSGGGVQLIDWRQDSLQKQATLPMSGNPRRALVNQNQLVAVSDSNVTSFDITQRSSALQTANLVIGTCELRTTNTRMPVVNNPGWNGNNTNNGTYYYDDYDQGAFACSATRTGGLRTSWATALVGLGLVVGSIVRRRASRRAA